MVHSILAARLQLPSPHITHLHTSLISTHHSKYASCRDSSSIEKGRGVLATG